MVLFMGLDNDLTVTNMGPMRDIDITLIYKDLQAYGDQRKTMPIGKYSLHNVIHGFQDPNNLTRIKHSLLFITQFICEPIRFPGMKNKITSGYEETNGTTLGFLVDDENRWSYIGYEFSQALFQEETTRLQMSKEIYDHVAMILEEPGVDYEEAEKEEEASSSTSTKKKKKQKVKEQKNQNDQQQDEQIQPNKTKKKKVIIRSIKSHLRGCLGKIALLLVT